MSLTSSLMLFFFLNIFTAQLFNKTDKGRQADFTTISDCYFGKQIKTPVTEDLAETHCINSCILKCHGPCPATQSGNHVILEAKILDQIDTMTLHVCVLQSIICTVCTQADDPSISAHNLEQGITLLPLRWVQL